MANKQKPVSTSSAESGTFDKGLAEDADNFHKKPNEWTQARNAVNNTIRGDIGELSNEASNYLCATAPYTIIGSIHVGGDEWAIFSTNDIDSEIGVFKEDSCFYKTIVNDPCLSLKKEFLIKGVGRTTFDCGRQVYWDDGNNPTRLLNLDDVPWIQDCSVVDACNICVDTDELDCDKIRLAPLFKDLSFNLELGQASGDMENGSFYVVGAYLVNGVKVSDYSLPSNVQVIFSHFPKSGSLDVFVQEADTEFDEFELVLVQFTNFNTVARKMGVYSTRQNKITFDTVRETLPTIDPGSILIQNNIPDKTDAIFRNGEYLIRTGPTDKFDFNYQPLANQIKTSWTSIEYPADYYRDGGSNTGYMRDEVYSFFVRWKFNTGDKSNSYHIPGRPSRSSDTAPVGNPDDIVPGDPTGAKQWEIYNTAIVDPLYPTSTVPDGGNVLGGGEMGYWQSSEIYDDDKPQIWNSNQYPWSTVVSTPYSNTLPSDYNLCGKNIRHHKFPDNALDTSLEMITNHYDPNGGTTIRVMGVQFANIKPPVDNDGVPLSNVVGYEILRGSREGNKTVFAKGMINNMREYVTIDNINAYGNQTQKTHLYPNYPYNPTAKIPSDWDYASSNPNATVDHFLTSRRSSYKGPGLGESPVESLNDFNAYLELESPLGAEDIFFGTSTDERDSYSNIRKDFITFHSPETNFRNPYLSGKELKVYGELNGEMTGKFQYPKDHPRHKFITNTAFLVSAIIGVGYAMLSTEGKKSTAHAAPSIDYGGTYTQVGPASVGTTGMAGPSALAAIPMSTAQTFSDIANKVINKALNYSALNVLQIVGGLNPNGPREAALQAGSTIVGSIGGQGGQMNYSREETAWGATPGGIRKLQGIPSFLTYWGEGVDKMLKIIYAFTPYRQYALQQISHGFYNTFSAPDLGSTRRPIDYQTYMNPEIQDFAGDYKINNIYRSRTVAFKLGRGLPLPYKVEDDSQALFSDVWDRTNNPNAWENDEFINAEFVRPISSHYVAYKQRLVNQYGQIANIIQVPVSTDTHDKDATVAESPVLFNGDVYVGRYTEKNSMFFFYDWLKGQPDGAEYDYKLREMITHPRFWMDTDPFDVGEFMRSIGSIFDINGTDTPGSFDIYMVSPSLGEINNPSSPLYDPLAPTALCDCEFVPFYNNGDTFTISAAQGGTIANNFTGVQACLLADSPYNCDSEIEDVCELDEDIIQLELYIQFLKDCACFKNDSGDGKCNDGDIDNPGLLAPIGPLGTATYQFNGATQEGCSPAYIFPYENNTGKCTVCPTWKTAVVLIPPTIGTVSSSAAYYLDEGKGKWARKINRLENRLNRKKKKRDKKVNKCYDKYLDGLDGDQEGFIGDLLSGIVTPGDKFAFDMEYPGKFRFRVKSAYMYLFNSGVRDFFCESEINLDARDWGDDLNERHYDHKEYTNLRELFSTDRIKRGNFLKYDYSLSISKLFYNFASWSSVQQRSYDPLVAETCFTYRPKRMLYSLPQSEENKKDNWRVFLPLNYKDFNSVATNVKPIAASGALILFQNESPKQFPGRDELRTDGGTKITIGDGGLFARPLQSVVNAENPHEYASCQNRLSVVNTPAGIFFISQNQGKIFQLGKGLKEISNQNLKWWFARFLPYQLTKHPTAFLDAVTGDQRLFELLDNPVIGIGCQTVYDNENGIVFFSKTDWEIRSDIADTVTYVSGITFKVNGILDVELGDPAYFTSASWTASYDPKIQSWIGFHDWHPDLVLPSKKTFMTTKDNGLWVHADRCDSYCNFYGIDYPFEVEFALHTVAQINTLRNVLYIMEVYVYDDNCYDRFHVLDENFDEAVIYNSEQCSGLLKLNLTPKNNAIEIVKYPVINPTNIDILYSKEEQKYRFNQFWDITDDRGEFNAAAQRTIFLTEANGYIKNLNPANINYNKFELERKKFRHYKNTVILRKLVSGDKNMIIAIAAQLNLNSPR
jgi:hypothetical protein